MYISGMIILTFFAVIGIAHFLSGILKAAGGYDEKTALILRELREDDAEVRVRSAVKRSEDMHCPHLLCECADAGARDICERLRADYPIIEITDALPFWDS